MGSEPSSVSASASSSPVSTSGCGKRGRDPEDEVYLDNLHSHKRYLSEMMASSLNGLTVGDPLPDNLMDSPARSETTYHFREDVSLQYSPMSEDSDDYRSYENSLNSCSSQPDSVPTSPVSPCRFQKHFGGPSGPPNTSYPAHGSPVPSVASSQARQRGSDSEGRFPSSPSDICQSADLRRAALLRSVQMRAQPSGMSYFESPFNPVQVPGHGMEAEEREYQIELCAQVGISGTENQGKLRLKEVNSSDSEVHRTNS